MSDFIKIEVKGLDILVAKLDQFKHEIQSGIKGASEEASREVLDTVGLRRYPESTAANQPPAPYYIRGRGTQYKSGANNYKSENYGKQWTTKVTGGWNITIGNRASYAPYLAGEQQSHVMAAIGWRKLIDVAREKVVKVVAIYDAWVARTIKRIGL
jgi:hypothetical protein